MKKTAHLQTGRRVGKKKCAKRRVLERNGSVASEGDVFVEKKNYFLLFILPRAYSFWTIKKKKKKRKRRRRIRPVFHIKIPLVYNSDFSQTSIITRIPDGEWMQFPRPLSYSPFVWDRQRHTAPSRSNTNFIKILTTHTAFSFSFNEIFNSYSYTSNIHSSH